jgi:hypothetical protein
MKCYLCAAAGRDEAAVATCPHCSAGLCFAHFENPPQGRPQPNYGSCSHAAQAVALLAKRSSRASVGVMNGRRIDQRPAAVGPRS